MSSGPVPRDRPAAPSQRPTLRRKDPPVLHVMAPAMSSPLYSERISGGDMRSAVEPSSEANVEPFQLATRVAGIPDVKLPPRISLPPNARSAVTTTFTPLPTDCHDEPFQRARPRA